LIDQNVGSPGGEALVFGDVIASPVIRDFHRVGNWFSRIAWKGI
jgi:hypothetical protein